MALLLFVLVAVIYLTGRGNCKSQLFSSQYQGLKVLYDSTDGENWYNASQSFRFFFLTQIELIIGYLSWGQGLVLFGTLPTHLQIHVQIIGKESPAS